MIGTIETIIGGGKTVIGGVKSIFDRKEPNAGSSSFVDALDNYEKISQAKARAILPNVTGAIKEGASDTQIAQIIAEAGGYSAGEVQSSWKWSIVQNWIAQTRAIQEQNTQSSRGGFDVAKAGFNPILGLLLISGAFGFWAYNRGK